MNKQLSKFFVTGLLAASVLPSAYAAAGSEGHGGDILCDAKIKSVSNNLVVWIKGHGPEVGNLDLSSSVFPSTSRPYSVSEYDAAMLALLKLPLDSSCVTNGDPGFPVRVGDDSKVCVSFVDSRGLHMKCDQAKLLGMNPDLQIEQIHHEYATNISGLEPDTGPISTYKISTQVSLYTQDVVERRLVVAPAKTCDSSGCTVSTTGLFNYTDAASNFPKTTKVSVNNIAGNWYMLGTTVANGSVTPFYQIWQTGYSDDIKMGRVIQFKNDPGPLGTPKLEAALSDFDGYRIYPGDWLPASETDSGTCFTINSFVEDTFQTYLNVECRGLADNSKLLCAIAFNDDSTSLPASIDSYRHQVVAYIVLKKSD